MGFYGDKVTHFTDSGEVDLKAELEARYGEILAIQTIDADRAGWTGWSGETISITAIRYKDGVVGMVAFSKYDPEDKTLWVKPVSEEEGPAVLAPKEILELLTPTDNYLALEWRGDSWRAIAESRVSLEELVTYTAECRINEELSRKRLLPGEKDEIPEEYRKIVDVAESLISTFFTDRDMDLAYSMVEDKMTEIQNTPGYENKYSPIFIDSRAMEELGFF